MDKPIKFSVIIPTYNRAAKVTRAVDSALALDGNAIEIIVVDDGSTDDTASALQAYGDAVHIISQANQGVSAARNRGVEAAKGDWVLFLDSDDIYYPNRIEAVERVLRHYPQADCIICTSDIQRNGVGKGTSYLQSTLPRYEAEKGDLGEVFPITDTLKYEFGKYHFVHTNTMTMKKSLCLECGGFPTHLSIGEDSYLWHSAVARAVEPVASKEIVSLYDGGSDGLFKAGSLNTNEKAVMATKAYLSRAQKFRNKAMDKGIQERLTESRYSYCLALLRAGQRAKAWRQALKIFWERPRFQTLRLMLSVLKG